ncbi:hypothetical protein PTKIN_Ptkin08bG0074900 [Pterospermum kingtungense]
MVVDLPADIATSLLRVGIIVYTPLRYYELDKPDLHVDVAGLGAIGHLAVKFAKPVGAKVTVIIASQNKKNDAIKNLGADSFLSGRKQK